MRRAVLILLLVLVWTAPAPARSDLTLIITRETVQRLLNALCPVTLTHTLSGGLPVRLTITFRNPRLRFHPGQENGRVTVELDYEINSSPPLVQGLKGRISPRLGLSFDPKAGVAILKVENFHLQLGGSGRIQMNQLLPPLRIPLGRFPAIEVADRRVKVKVVDLKVRVTPKALIVRARLDYRGSFAR